MASPLVSLLRKYGHQYYHIEYSGFLTNHIAHGLVSLSHMGADSDTLSKFAADYSVQLEPPVKDDRQVTPQTWQNWLGLAEGYVPLVRFFQQELIAMQAHGGSWRTLLATYLPQLLEGMAGAALHPIIHMGYGVEMAAKCDGATDLLIEALAYATYSYRSLGPMATCVAVEKEEEEGLTLLQALERVRHDKAFGMAIDFVHDPVYRHLHYPEGFQKRVTMIGLHAREALQRHTQSLALCQALQSTKGRDRQWMAEQAVTLEKELLYVYSHAAFHNDFFLLHCVTACQGLRDLLPCLEDPADMSTALQYFCKALLAAYYAQGAPPINSNFSPTSPVSTWAALRQRCLDGATGGMEVHCIKLVDACHALANGKKEWGCVAAVVEGDSTAADFDVVMRRTAQLAFDEYHFG